MNPIACAGLGFGVAALVAGTIAAYFWYHASLRPLEIKPAFDRMKVPAPENPKDVPEFIVAIERPGELSTKALVAFAIAVKFGLERTSHLNSIAARWSAAAAILGGISAIFGSLR